MYASSLFWIEQSSSDHWADDLKIPENLEIYKPINLFNDEKKSDSITNSHITSATFQLYNSFQPGLYQYSFGIGKIESGVIYLKAFEITQNYPLSVEELQMRSSVKIYNPADSIKNFGMTDFTIYEGDWGKPYAARFEVWFKPDRAGQERKLLSKNYIIEGWMR